MPQLGNFLPHVFSVPVPVMPSNHMFYRPASSQQLLLVHHFFLVHPEIGTLQEYALPPLLPFIASATAARHRMRMFPPLGSSTTTTPSFASYLHSTHKMIITAVPLATIIVFVFCLAGVMICLRQRRRNRKYLLPSSAHTRLYIVLRTVSTRTCVVS